MLKYNILEIENIVLEASLSFTIMTKKYLPLELGTTKVTLIYQKKIKEVTGYYCQETNDTLKVNTAPN